MDIPLLWRHHFPLHQHHHHHSAPFHAPRMDVSESEQEYRVRADLPGRRSDALQVEFHKGVLTIRALGEGKGQSRGKQDEEQGQEADDAKHKQQQPKWHLKERFQGTLERSLQFPKAINGNAIRSAYKDGVLEVVLPKSEEEKPTKVHIGARL
ncbi:Heat shock 70 kDa protein 1A [Balamuthia mandrillaris]